MPSRPAGPDPGSAGPDPGPGDGDTAEGPAPRPEARGVPWTRSEHGVDGIPPCRKCGSAMERAGGRYGLQLWSDHWLCPACGWELRLSYGRGSV